MQVLELEKILCFYAANHDVDIYWTMQIPLEIAAPLDHKRLEGLKLSLSGDHQLINAGLAVSLCKCWLQKVGKWDNLIGKVSFILITPSYYFPKKNHFFLS